MHEEIEVVNWYIQVFEGGHNTKNLLKEFIAAKAEIKTLEAKAKRTKE